MNTVVVGTNDAPDADFLGSCMVPYDMTGAINEFYSAVPAIVSHYSRHYDNVHMLNSAVSSWHNVTTIISLLQSCKKSRELYETAIQQDLAASIYQLNVTRAFYRSHRSKYRDYCPVCWLDGQTLTKHVKDMKFTVEYQRTFYRCCSQKHMQTLIDHTNKYVVHPTALPVDIPYRVRSSDCDSIHSDLCELQCYCAVSLYEGRERGLIQLIPGIQQCIVQYKQKLYKLAGEKQLLSFMATPHKYYNIKLPHNMKPNKVHINNKITVPVLPVLPTTNGTSSSKQPVSTDTINSTGGMDVSGGTGSPSEVPDMLSLGHTLAFLEVGFSKLLMRGLNALENQRLKHSCKYPHLSISSSALLFLSLYLKANNPNNESHITHKYSASLQSFMNHCQLITAVAKQYKGMHMTQNNSNATANTNKEKETQREREREKERDMIIPNNNKCICSCTNNINNNGHIGDNGVTGGGSAVNGTCSCLCHANTGVMNMNAESELVRSQLCSLYDELRNKCKVSGQSLANNMQVYIR